MKKRFNVLLVNAVIFGLGLSLFGMALVSQAASAKKNQSWHRQAPAPAHATNIKVVKKIFIPEDVRITKGKPINPGNSGKNKTEEKAATGILGATATGTKYAIVIGIGDYPDTDYDLYESDGDSLHMYKALTTLYGYEPANIYLLRDMGEQSGFREPNYGEPTHNNIYSAIMDIQNKATSTDEVTFFFSGHGTKGNYSDDDTIDNASGVDLDGLDEAIAVHDDDGLMDEDGYSDLDFIWDGELRSWFSNFATTRINFVFDSCLAGGMNDVADVGRVISMATDETHSAYVYTRAGEDVDGDETNDGESVFTRLFAYKGMLDGLADVHDYTEVEGNEPATVEEAFDYAKDSIPPYLKHRQKPVISDGFTKDLLL